ncbi:hypothetical protein [Pseudoxanthomonas composti]|uniref:hypothetical protein n=1 Tax=Pseudoxanthomonas composti TaxID=2137479 RepID=UPI001F51546E|nr:hypothetical protein [Pseudoxanthomonas composti]
MFKPRTIAHCALAALLWPLAVAAQDAPAPQKKLYCWNDRGTRVCSDALPPEQVNNARQEFSANSGARTSSVAAAMTDEERANAALVAAQEQADAAAAETKRRTEQAMLTSYASEDDLRRVFGERTALLDNNVKTARYNIASLREGLVMLLQRAGERELGGKPVDAKLAGEIAERHRVLLEQQRMATRFETQRASLDDDITETLERYRQMKQPDAPGA